ncbi:unnamed protein product [Allacma fusca]|uniref:Pinin/SDK/MemA protein domain-containing protein n=1 Tax=Allacma fusca TaxID=39272 RepID=A0A8J2NN27_9HEXA|nr:unnamed protein product [Allacma fusca]
MATDVISSLAGSLDAEIEKARENLKGVDSNIKKLFGKDVSEFNSFSKFGRRGGHPQEYTEAPHEHPNTFAPNRGHRRRDEFERHEDEPGEKRRRVEGRPPPVVIGPRLRPRFDAEEEYDQGHGNLGRRLQSRIVSSTREKSRDEVLAEQSKDKIGIARNRRMFGALLGTLHRFKQEETKLKTKEEKRAQIEAKLDEAAKREREEVKKEKLQLIRERKLQLTEIKRLEIKRRRIAELEQWENKTRFLTNFIRTEAKPHIFYLPKMLNPVTECRLDQSKQCVTEMISSKRKLVLEDLEEFEQRSRRYWESRVDGDAAPKRAEVDPMDEDMEFELKEIMKREDMSEEVEDFTVTVFETSKDEPESMEDAVEEEEKKSLILSVKVEAQENLEPDRDQEMEEGEGDEEDDGMNGETKGSPPDNE